ncbi:MAG: ATP-binding protein, partial [Gemmatimonadaceae bacterium]
MTIGLGTTDVATAEESFDALVPALVRLDVRLGLAVERARVAHGVDAAADRFRGLYIADADVDRMLAREPGSGAFLAGDDMLGDEWDVRDDGSVAAGSRLERLARMFDLTPFDVDVLVIALAPALDLRYERLYAFLQDDVSRRRPTVDLVLSLLCATSRERGVRRAHFMADAPLMRHRLVRVAAADGAPTLAATIEVDEQVVTYLLGHDALDRRLAACCATVQPPASSATTRSALADADEGALQRVIFDARDARRSLRLYFGGVAGMGKRTTARTLIARAGVTLLEVDLARAHDAPDPGMLVSLALRHGRLQDAVVLLHDVSSLTPVMREAVAEHPGIVILCGSTPAPSVADMRDAVVVSFAHPPIDRRSDLWRDALATHDECVAGDTLDALAVRFRMTPRQVVDAVSAAVRMAQLRGDALRGEDLFASARAQSGQELEALASRVPTRQRWADLVLPDDSLQQLREICQRVAGRETVLDRWGFSERVSHGSGVNALFSGPSGTGKTMAAGVMAHELGVDLFRVDLAGVVSKYIGETEKNLDRIFTAAEDANGIIFFDEADALFGKRSEVHDSHDRYANIEVSYLLQKMEQFSGIAILATNLRANLDAAFIRRLAFLVHFP